MTTPFERDIGDQAEALLAFSQSATPPGLPRLLRGHYDRVVLTGMGSDGLEGCRAVHHAGGKILVQDRQTSAVWGMPGVVAESGIADAILPLDAMTAEIVRIVARRRGITRPDEPTLRDIADGLHRC